MFWRVFILVQKPFISWSDQGIEPKQFSNKVHYYPTSHLMNRYSIRKTVAWLPAFPRAGSSESLPSLYSPLSSWTVGRVNFRSSSQIFYSSLICACVIEKITFGPFWDSVGHSWPSHAHTLGRWTNIQRKIAVWFWSMCLVHKMSLCDGSMTLCYRNKHIQWVWVMICVNQFTCYLKRCEPDHTLSKTVWTYTQLI